MYLRDSSGPDPCIQLREKDHSHLTDEAIEAQTD